MKFHIYTSPDHHAPNAHFSKDKFTFLNLSNHSDDLTVDLMDEACENAVQRIWHPHFKFYMGGKDMEIDIEGFVSTKNGEFTRIRYRLFSEEKVRAHMERSADNGYPDKLVKSQLEGVVWKPSKPKGK